MNNYHLYEEIGHGKFSTVYKGRKRHTIRYVAVKSIEKSRREKVMKEVDIMSQLHHPNIVGFINWYETRNHLWILFEYCPGGDLLRLLKQDLRLPEEQVRLFARDVCAGLLYVHAHGVIYSDLKPANMIFNEDGVLKLCDFGHSQRLREIELALEEEKTLPRRGTPHYMAPELFHEGGIHSFASDIWALGCVMYEMLVGRPPFHSSCFTQLQDMILHDPTPLAGSGSPELQALLAIVLRKGPLDRGDWMAVRGNGFWQGRAPGDDGDFAALPAQPHLEQLQRAWQSAQSLSGRRPKPSTTSVGSSPAGQSPSDKAGPAEVRSQHTPLDSRAGGRHVVASGSEANEVAELDMYELKDRLRPATVRPDATEAGQVPSRGATAQAAADAAASAAAAAAAAQHVAAPTASAGSAMQVVAQTPSIPPSSLRERLGATNHARARELIMVIETSVRPISRNPQIEEPEPLETPSDLPFAPMSLEAVCSRPHADVEAFLTKVYKCMAQGSLDQKLGVLKYLEHLCCHMQVADLVVNSSLLRLVLRMLHTRKGGSGGATGPNGNASAAAASPPLRAQLLSFIGQLLGHATYLEAGVADLGLFDVLLEGLRDHDLVVRRRSAAALGELLFYVATQPSQPASPSSPNARKWQVPPNVLQELSQTLLGPGQDEIVQHYIAKTMENVSTQCPAIALQWFNSPELLSGLDGHIRRSLCEQFRLSCLATAVNLLRGRTEERQADAHVVEPDLIDAGLLELAPHGVPHSLQLVAAILLRAPSLDAADATLPGNVTNLLVRAASQPRYSGAIRGRAALLLTLLFVLDDARSAKHLREAIDQGFVPLLDRLGREKDSFVVQCVAVAAAATDVAAAATLQSLVDSLRQLTGISDATAAAEFAGELVQTIPVFWHLLSSATLCGCVISSHAIALLGIIGELSARTSPSSLAVPPRGGQAGEPLHQLQPLVLMVMEQLATQQALLLEHAPQAVQCVLPALVAFLPSRRSDVRLLGVKAFSDMCIAFLNDDHVFNPTAEAPNETTLLIEALLCGRVLPLLPTILADDPPAPSIALRLLATLLSRGSSAAGVAVREVGLSKQLLAVLQAQQGLTVHAAILAHCLLRAHDASVHDLEGAGVLGAVHDVLVAAAEAAVGCPAQMNFALLDAALCVQEEALAQVSTSLVPPGGIDGDIGAELGPLACALPLLAVLCAPLAHAKLAPLLDRATVCCQYLADIARGQDRRRLAIEMPAEGIASLLEALAAVARWKHADHAMSCALQRRLLSVLGWATAGQSALARAELAAGVEQLLRDRLLLDDCAVTADARGLIAVAVGRGAG